LSFVVGQKKDGFVPSTFSWLAALEDGFWWFEARNDIIEWAMAKWCAGASSFLEIGCGTGFVSSRIARAFPNVDISAGELFPEGLRFVSQRLPAATIYQLDARRMPFRKEFDVVGAFDVVEHIDEDDKVFQEIYKALKPSGVILLTVPQHPFLWSEFDTYGHHKRRYTRRQLKERLENAGFEILALRSFVSLLFPLQLVTRCRSCAQFDIEAEFRISPLMNRSLGTVMRVESALIRAGISFPFGGSLLAVARA
jgi:SAM-dependent methyltransferase